MSKNKKPREESAEGWDSIVFYKSWAKILLNFPPDLRLKIHDAIDRYILTCELPAEPEVLYSPFAVFREQILLDKEEYKKSCERNAANVSKRYQKDTDATTEYDGIRPNTTVTKATDNDKDNDKDKDNDNEKGVWGKNARAYAREETHPHSHWAITEENDKCPWDDRYRRFNDWMKEKAEYCAKHMQRITPEQFGRVLDGKEDFNTGRTMTKDGLFRMIADIENKNDARGRYNNLWTTVRKFWNQEHKQQN